ncbi:MAG: hypothetical protein ACKV2T_06375 [Kofleriaceae bacterium]
MSARALRRSFATPFVLTLAAVPACVVSSPPPSSPQTTRSGPAHDEPDHANPPAPQPETQTAPTQAPPTVVANPPRPQEAPANTRVNDQVKNTANTSSTTVAQTEPAITDKASAPKARGYREWSVTKANGTCKSMVKVSCPEGAICNPPPPAKYECPKFMADNDKIAVIQRTEKAECYVDHGDFTCPPAASCNPPRPQQLTCPK